MNKLLTAQLMAMIPWTLILAHNPLMLVIGAGIQASGLAWAMKLREEEE